LTSPVDSSVKAFLSKACRTASCGAFVVPIRRTLQAIKPLRKGVKLVEIPRSMQIWDLDALQDPFVRALLSARHARTENKLPSGAFLAVWLAMQKVNTTVKDPLLKSYLELLPSETDVQSHPVFWKSDFNEMLGGHSYTINIARMYKDMVQSEYAVSGRKMRNQSISFFNFVFLTIARLCYYVVIGQSESRVWQSNYSCRLQNGSDPCLVS
jgi:hypothetical protein